MLTDFSPLTVDEKEAMLDAIALITVLVAGADGEIDNQELNIATHVTDTRGFDDQSKLRAYYDQVQPQLEARVKELERTLPTAVADRQSAIAGRLAPINTALAKLDPALAYAYYHSFRTFAQRVAEASGGFMRYFTVGPKEDKVMHLPMITPIAEPEADAESE